MNFERQLSGKLTFRLHHSRAAKSPKRPKPARLKEHESSDKDRNKAIDNAYLSFGYTLKEVGRHLGLHDSPISELIKHHNSKNPRLPRGGGVPWGYPLY